MYIAPRQSELKHGEIAGEGERGMNKRWGDVTTREISFYLFYWLDCHNIQLLSFVEDPR